MSLSGIRTESTVGYPARIRHALNSRQNAFWFMEIVGGCWFVCRPA
jgi:hypothetical protein